MLCVGLSLKKGAHRPRPQRLATLRLSFTAAAGDLRSYTLCNHDNISRIIMCKIVNYDIRIWVNKFMRFALTSQQAVVPPLPGMVFAVPLFPAFARRCSFFRSGELFKSVEQTAPVRVGGGASWKRAASMRYSFPGAGAPKNIHYKTCNMFIAMRRCKWRDFIYVHDTYTVDSSSPATRSV